MGRRIDEATWNYIEELLQDGVHPREIAKAAEVSVSTVNKLANGTYGNVKQVHNIPEKLWKEWDEVCAMFRRKNR